MQSAAQHKHTAVSLAEIQQDFKEAFQLFFTLKKIKEMEISISKEMETSILKQPSIF